MSAIKISSLDLLSGGNSVNSAAHFPPRPPTPPPTKPPKTTRSSATLFTRVALCSEHASALESRGERRKQRAHRHDADEENDQAQVERRKGQDRDLQRERDQHAPSTLARMAGQGVARDRLLARAEGARYRVPDRGNPRRRLRRNLAWSALLEWRGDSRQGSASNRDPSHPPG